MYKETTKPSRVRFTDKLGWHYYFRVGRFVYLHGRFNSKKTAYRIMKAYNH